MRFYEESQSKKDPRKQTDSAMRLTNKRNECKDSGVVSSFYTLDYAHLSPDTECLLKDDSELFGLLCWCQMVVGQFGTILIGPRVEHKLRVLVLQVP